MYYVLDRFGASNPCRWIGRYPYIDGVDWRSGARHVKPIPAPLEITLKPLNRDASDHGPELPEYFKGKIPLFRLDLVNALSEAGAENLDLYDVCLVDPDSGNRHNNYQAVNIIGTVTSTGMDAANGELIVRLADSANAILVHEKLKNQLQACGFTKLEFLDPGETAL